MKQKICIATPEFPPDQWGGLARTVERVACHVRDMGLQVHVAHLSVGDQTPVLLDENCQSREWEGLQVHSITLGKEKPIGASPELWDCPHNLTLQMMYQSLDMLQAREEFALLHSFFLYPVGYVAGLLARRIGIPAIVTLVGNDVNRYFFSPEKVGVCRSGLENADRVVALSKDLADLANALTPIGQKVRIIYNSVTIPNRDLSSEKSDPETFRIGCAGIFKYAKGLPYLFKAAAQLAREQKVKLELVGHVRDSEKEVYQYMLDKTRMHGIVSLRDPIPHDRIWQWFQTIDVFVLPSLTEGCPNVLMEAMAAGVPVIATATGAVHTLIEDQVSGLVVPWGDSAALASALQRILDNPGLARTMGSAGRARMESFTSHMERRAWQGVYRELLVFES